MKKANTHIFAFVNKTMFFDILFVKWLLSDVHTMYTPCTKTQHPFLNKSKKKSYAFMNI